MSLPDFADKLLALASALIDQDAATILVPPRQNSTGFWFGGGNIVRDRDSDYLLCGRYRNFGDSRTGVGAGERGLEFAIFRAASLDGPWEKIVSFSKADLSHDGTDVVSIEGGALLPTRDGIELYVSTEKDLPYPHEIEVYQKPGTGVWSIDLIVGAGVRTLDPSTATTILECEVPSRLHIKDPVPIGLENGVTGLIYCNHPHTWSSSSTGVAVRKPGSKKFKKLTEEALPRGPVWDVSATRVTEKLKVPRIGVLADQPQLSLYFYDGAECLRQLDENPRAVKRPRGWSCEEIGGVAWGYDSEFPQMDRLSIDGPLFISPHGTGCSRYISTLATGEGIFAAWQQSQDDLSQPLVGHFLPMDRVTEILS